jgi:hypothetical protein
MGRNNIYITKASGIKDIYAADKLRNSLAKSGASYALIETILSEIEKKLYDGIPTQKIYREAFRLLKKASRSHAGRYDLKRAIMALGPSGYPFEQYVGAIFEWQGYQVKVKQFLEGICVTHEIDVLAENDQQVLLIECKYHNSQGIFSDVKVPLYINSRYRDVLDNWHKTAQPKPLEGWVVTNTKFSSDAVKYGICAGLHLLGWNYPVKKSLSTFVDESGLYPVTCLTSLTRKEKEKILTAEVVLCKDLGNKTELLKEAAISSARIPGIINEIDALCRRTNSQSSTD